jgi:hypothetical protein
MLLDEKRMRLPSIPDDNERRLRPAAVLDYARNHRKLFREIINVKVIMAVAIIGLLLSTGYLLLRVYVYNARRTNADVAQARFESTVDALRILHGQLHAFAREHGGAYPVDLYELGSRANIADGNVSPIDTLTNLRYFGRGQMASAHADIPLAAVDVQGGCLILFNDGRTWLYDLSAAAAILAIPATRPSVSPTAHSN